MKGGAVIQKSTSFCPVLAHDSQPCPEDFGERFKWFRNSLPAKISQDMMADKLQGITGVSSRSSIQRLEAGSSKLNIDALGALKARLIGIARGAGVDPDYAEMAANYVCRESDRPPPYQDWRSARKKGPGESLKEESPNHSQAHDSPADDTGPAKSFSRYIFNRGFCIPSIECQTEPRLVDLFFKGNVDSGNSLTGFLSKFNPDAHRWRDLVDRHAEPLVFYRYAASLKEAYSDACLCGSNCPCVGPDGEKYWQNGDTKHGPAPRLLEEPYVEGYKLSLLVLVEAKTAYDREAENRILCHTRLSIENGSGADYRPDPDVVGLLRSEVRFLDFLSQAFDNQASEKLRDSPRSYQLGFYNGLLSNFEEGAAEGFFAVGKDDLLRVTTRPVEQLALPANEVSPVLSEHQWECSQIEEAIREAKASHKEALEQQASLALLSSPEREDLLCQADQNQRHWERVTKQTVDAVIDLQENVEEFDKEIARLKLPENIVEKSYRFDAIQKGRLRDAQLLELRINLGATRLEAKKAWEALKAELIKALTEGAEVRR